MRFCILDFVLFCLFGNRKQARRKFFCAFISVNAGTEVNETAEKLTHKKKADLNLKLKSTLLFFKFYALIFAVDFRFSLCYSHLTEKANF